MTGYEKKNLFDVTVTFKNGKVVNYTEEKTGLFRWNGPYGFTTDPSVKTVMDSTTGEIIYDS